MKTTLQKTTAAAMLAVATCFGASADWGNAATPGVMIDRSNMYDIETAYTPDGSAYVVWTRWSEAGAGRGFTLHAQLLDKQGNKMWGDDGILVDNHITPSWCSNWNIITTPENELVISWADARSEEGTDVGEHYEAQDPVLYKLNKEGKMLWGDEGVALDNQKYKYPAMLFQVEGNVYARCYGREDSDPTQLMLLDEFGEPAWKSAKNFSGQIIGSEGEDFLAVYSASEGVMAMRYSKDMRQRWKAPTLISEKQYGGYDLNPYLLRSDGHGGMAVCYLTALGDFGHMPLVAYVTGDGETAFSEDVADTDMYDHLYPVISINPETETIMTIWQMNAGPSGHSVQGEQMDYFGERQWGPMGKALVSKDTDAYSYGTIAVEPLKDGQWLVCYADEFAYEDYQMILARVDAEGNVKGTLNVGNRGPIYAPKVRLSGDVVEVLWEEDYDYVDEETGYDVHSRSIMGARVNLDEIKESGVDEITAETAGKEYYSISGIRLNGPAKGLNIVRNADGTVSKVIVK